MQKLFNRVWNPFSRYADSHEKRVQRLLNKVVRLNKFELQDGLEKLMQQNLVVLNLWLEKRFKGYKYLGKWNRKKLYRNADGIVKYFDLFCSNLSFPASQFEESLKMLGFDCLPAYREKLEYIYKIMLFLHPGKYYEYLEGASFGKMLAKVPEQKMIGDCNQIVTFYAFLYSLKYPISDLKIKLLPEHVCLHFFGVDIEATNGSFQIYKEYDYLLRIVELLTTNLLDINDFRDKQYIIDARSVVNSSELAFRVSSIRDIVEKNLNVSYHNLVVESARQNDFYTAFFFLQKLNNRELKLSVCNQAVRFYVEKGDYSKAKDAADKSQDLDLMNYVKNQQAYAYYKSNDLERAKGIYRELGNDEMLKACYAKEYNSLSQKVSGAKTVEQARAFRYDYQKMRDLAQMMGDSALENEINKIISQL